MGCHASHAIQVPNAHSDKRDAPTDVSHMQIGESIPSHESQHKSQQSVKPSVSKSRPSLVHWKGHVLFLLGPPYVHRSKLARELSTEFDCHIISWEDFWKQQQQILSQELSEDDFLIFSSSTSYSADNIVDFIISSLLALSDDRPVIIEGLPIETSQAIQLEKKGLKPNLVIQLDCTQDVLNQKISENHSKKDTKLIQSLTEHMETYCQAELELIDHFSQQQTLRKISANQESFIRIYESLRDLIRKEKQVFEGSLESKSPQSSPQVKGDTPKRRLLVLAGPSGVGKSVLIKRLKAEFPSSFGFSVSHTTRQPRPGEKHGVDYYFSSHQEIQHQISLGLFIEHAEVHGNLYGTSRTAVTHVWKEGRDCILDIDIKGCKQIQQQKDITALFIFITPPSLEVLEKRLRDRGTETEEAIQRRIRNAAIEMEQSKEPGLFDHILVNDVLDKAYEDLKRFIFPTSSSVSP